jgi:hypothetical protein
MDQEKDPLQNEIPIAPAGIVAEDATRVLGGSQTAVEKASSFLSGFASKNTALTAALLGTGGNNTETFYPAEMIGGNAPHVPGQEDEMAWQAGVEAADSERLHYVWSVKDGMLWYIAVQSADLSSHATSWCPFAALLPGMPQAEESPVIYMHVADEASMIMSVGQTTLQVHRGANMIIQAKAERIAHDLGGARIINLMPDYVDKLEPVQWRSASLLEDKARRFMATVAAGIGIVIASVAFVIWVLSGLATLGISHSVEESKIKAAQASQDLLQQATTLRVSTLRNQIAKFVDVNDGLIKVGGWLQEYKIDKNKVGWIAVVPAGITSEKINEIGAKTKEVTDAGVIVEGK